VFVVAMTSSKPTSVVLTRAHRDAIFEEIEFAFESARDLPFMLEHAVENTVDSDEARDLIRQLQVAVGILDQIGWQPSGDRDAYPLEVDEAVDGFAARIESFALAALEYNRGGLLAGDEALGATARRLIDADLEKLEAARVLRTGFRIARAFGPPAPHPLDTP
jgi:hypothetical protein